MVKKEKTIPPVYVLALAAAAVVYPVSFIKMDRIFLFTVVCSALLGMAVLSTCLSLVLLQKQSSRTILLLLYLLTGILIGSLCSLRIGWEKMSLFTLVDQSRVSSIQGELLTDPIPYGPSLYRAAVRLDSCSYPDSTLFSARGRTNILIPAPLVRESLPGGIEQKEGMRILYASGMNVEMEGTFSTYDRSKGESFLVSGANKSSVLWSTPVHLFRAKIRLSLMRILYDWKDAGGFLLALLSANRDYLNTTLAKDFKTTGLSHILALSGMHLSFLGLLAIQGGKRIGGKNFSLRLSLLAMVLFVWFAGASPSLDRALIMALLMIGAKKLGFKNGVLPILASTFLIQTILNPADALSLGFMLSYTALWGIVTFGKYLAYILSRYVAKPVYSEISVSIGAQMMTTPIVAFGIGVLAPIGIIASCIISPLSSIFLIIGIVLTFIAVVVPPFTVSCGLILDYLYQTIVFPVHLFASFPPLIVKPLLHSITASIIPLGAGLALMWVSARAAKRRSPDANFTRL